MKLDVSNKRFFEKQFLFKNSDFHNSTDQSIYKNMGKNNDIPEALQVFDIDWLLLVIKHHLYEIQQILWRQFWIWLLWRGSIALKIKIWIFIDFQFCHGTPNTKKYYLVKSTEWSNRQIDIPAMSQPEFTLD